MKIIKEALHRIRENRSNSRRNVVPVSNVIPEAKPIVEESIRIMKVELSHSLNPEEVQRLDNLKKQFGAWGIVYGALLEVALGEERALEKFEQYSDRRSLVDASMDDIEWEIIKEGQWDEQDDLMKSWEGRIAHRLGIPKSAVKYKHPHLRYPQVWIEKAYGELLDKEHPDKVSEKEKSWSLEEFNANPTSLVHRFHDKYYIYY